MPVSRLMDFEVRVHRNPTGAGATVSRSGNHRTGACKRMEQTTSATQGYDDAKPADNDTARSDRSNPCPICSGNSEVCEFASDWPRCLTFIVLAVY